jgi:hypothetical protein
MTMETVSQLLAERDAAEAEEKRTFEELCEEVRRTAVALEATQHMLRVAVGYTVARQTSLHLGQAVLNGMPLPCNVDFPPWVHDALKVLGQRAQEKLM